MSKTYAVAVVLAAVAVAVVVVGGLYAPGFTLEVIKDVLNDALGTLLAIAGTWALWNLYEKRRWEGWSLAVTNRQGDQIQKPLPPTVIKRWMEDSLSDFAGFRDLTGSVNRWPGCGLVTVDSDQARALGALRICKHARTVWFDYSKLPAPPVPTGQGPR
jgi:hypothetical protein